MDIFKEYWNEYFHRQASYVTLIYGNITAFILFVLLVNPSLAKSNIRTAILGTVAAYLYMSHIAGYVIYSRHNKIIAGIVALSSLILFAGISIGMYILFHI